MTVVPVGALPVLAGALVNRSKLQATLTSKQAKMPKWQLEWDCEVEELVSPEATGGGQGIGLASGQPESLRPTTSVNTSHLQCFSDGREE